MNLTEIAKEFAYRTDLNEDMTAGLVAALFRLMVEKLQGGHDVRIRGFGAFNWKTLKARSIIHPISGKQQDLPERQVLRFLPSRSIRRRTCRTTKT